MNRMEGRMRRKPGLSLARRQRLDASAEMDDKENVPKELNIGGSVKPAAQKRWRLPSERDGDHDAVDQTHENADTQCGCGKSVRRSSVQHSKICRLFQNHKTESKPTSLSRTPPFRLVASKNSKKTPPPSPSHSPRGRTHRSAATTRRALPAEVDEEDKSAEEDAPATQDEEQNGVRSDDDGSDFTPDVLCARKVAHTRGARSGSPMVVLAYYSSSSDDEDGDQEELSEEDWHTSQVWDDENNEDDDIIIPCSQPRPWVDRRTFDDESQRVVSDDDSSEHVVPHSQSYADGDSATAQLLSRLSDQQLEDEGDIFISQPTHSYPVEIDPGSITGGNASATLDVEEDEFAFHSFIEGTESAGQSSPIGDEEVAHEGRTKAIGEAETRTDPEVTKHVENHQQVEEIEEATLTATEHAKEKHETDLSAADEGNALLLLLRSLRLESHYPRFVQEEVSLSDLALLTDEELERHLGLRLGPRRRLQHALSFLHLPPAFSSADAERIRDLLAKGRSEDESDQS